MNIGTYTFQKFKDLAAGFHGYPAPGILIGGYMVEAAKSRLPAETLFEALVETGKCLPDAVQLLTLCSTGNNWMKVVHLGRYAFSLYDKYTGQGYRVSLDLVALQNWPEIRAWFLKLKPKPEQDTARLFAEIEQAGDSYLKIQPVCLAPKYLGKKHMAEIGVCSVCGEAYPQKDGDHPGPLQRNRQKSRTGDHGRRCLPAAAHGTDLGLCPKRGSVGLRRMGP